MSESSDLPVQVTDETFDKFVSAHPLTLVDCWAPWCGPCRQVGPIVDTLAREYKGKVAFAKLNTDENYATANKFSIMAIPTLLILKQGKLVDQLVGAYPKAKIEETLKRHMA
jgi:thioredoxin 1